MHGPQYDLCYAGPTYWPHTYRERWCFPLFASSWLLWRCSSLLGVIRGVPEASDPLRQLVWLSRQELATVGAAVPGQSQHTLTLELVRSPLTLHACTQVGGRCKVSIMSGGCACGWQVQGEHDEGGQCVWVWVGRVGMRREEEGGEGQRLVGDNQSQSTSHAAARMPAWACTALTLPSWLSSPSLPGPHNSPW